MATTAPNIKSRVGLAAVEVGSGCRLAGVIVLPRILRGITCRGILLPPLPKNTECSHDWN